GAVAPTSWGHAPLFPRRPRLRSHDARPVVRESRLMLVVAESSPINIVVRIECVQVLSALFESVLIPPDTRSELLNPRTPGDVRAFVQAPPAWFRVQAPPQYRAHPAA